MKALLQLLCAASISLLALGASAEQAKQLGDLKVHYSAFNSTFLQPEIAAASGLVRGKQTGVLNIAVQKEAKPVAGIISGEVKNLLSQVQPLTFKEIREGEALYYLAQFTFDKRETLSFTVRVQGIGDDAVQQFTFTQEFFAAE
ncbi:DUF4426 domain-containing protein [Atopomonas sediminilitoris]|uniref:DUF4426 domain-containing protein n=1 Tax=Atopomonas sediminilitoris TaxID=2919919 RepID=UPI001F4D9113|nr:DUF4426 domain-containing protein [Atopomonas sediminilitoris]MCJ8170556.1 DUF4426 domain-containing protein [Atopomonas sediminilitoris]